LTRPVNPASPLGGGFVWEVACGAALPSLAGSAAVEESCRVSTTAVPWTGFDEGEVAFCAEQSEDIEITVDIAATMILMDLVLEVVFMELAPSVKLAATRLT